MPGRRRRLAQRRKTVGFSQESLAEAVGVDRSTVVRWERGDTDPQPWHRRNLAAALMQSPDELASLLADGDEAMPGLADAAVVETFSGAAVGLFTPSLQASAIPTGGNDLAAMRSLRLADRQIGGGYLYAAVTGYLQANLAPRLFGQRRSSGSEQPTMFAAAAGLTEMAGWMAHDAGCHQLAEQHFHRALGMARIAQDHQIAAHVLGSLSHLAHHVRHPDRGNGYAGQGHGELKVGQLCPTVEARLVAMQARYCAATNDPARCTELLHRAEQLLSAECDDEPSPWVSTFDEAALAAESARCFRLLGQFQAAQRRAEEIVQLRPWERTRSRAFAQLVLISVALAENRIDEACGLTHELLIATRALGSQLVVQQLDEVRRSLLAHRRSSVVATLLAFLDEELRERRSWEPLSSSTETETLKVSMA